MSGSHLIVCLGLDGGHLGFSDGSRLSFRYHSFVSIDSLSGHWQRCYSSIWAGAGIEPGRVIGQSNRYGEDPITRPITPLMVGTTITELVGMGPQERAELKVLDGGTVIHELVG